MVAVTSKREVVPVFSAVAYLKLAKANFSWRSLPDDDRRTLKGLAVETDDSGRVRFSRARRGRAFVAAVDRLVGEGFVVPEPRVGRMTAYRLALPKHLGVLAVIDNVRKAWREETPSGQRFFALLGYAQQWRAAQSRVRAALRNWAGKPRRSRVRLED